MSHRSGLTKRGVKGGGAGFTICIQILPLSDVISVGHGHFLPDFIKDTFYVFINTHCHGKLRVARRRGENDAAGGKLSIHFVLFAFLSPAKSDQALFHSFIWYSLKSNFYKTYRSS